VLLAVLGLLIACSTARAAAMDATTLTGKLIMGYQGWFACPGDAAHRGWVHWSAGGAPTTDMLPDMAELPSAERCASPMIAADGHTVDLFSSQNPATVDRHFAWMARYGLDGVALQRFATQLLRPEALAASDAVLANVRRAAEDHGRAFFLMYDLSGMPPERLGDVAQDWARLQARGLTGSTAYLRHRGHPLLGLWGLGFHGRPMTPDDARRLLAALAEASGGEGGVTILGGVPGRWRSGQGDAAPDPGWREVWPKLDVISPWTVGGYIDEAGADRYRMTVLEQDLREARRIGADYLPVVFPGFSWANMMRARHAPEKAIFNQIPRRCGRFYWRQVFNALSGGATMLYGAMFDEVDEGTAMFKLLPSADQAPVRGLPPGDAFVTLDVDGCKLPSDWYLRLAGAATEAVAHRRPPSADLPLPLPPQGPSRPPANAGSLH
jgi:hypothetical protein